MNNVTPFIKSPRLTEQEVHEAAQNLIDSNENISSLALLKALGRGSLTTITKYMSTFNLGDESTAQVKLPDFTELPETLSRSTKLLAIKIWAESQEIANNELENQRDVLQQAAKLSAERVKEAEAFSDEQAKRIDEIERNYQHEIDLLKKDLYAINSELSEKSAELNQLVIDLEVSKNGCNLLKDSLSDSNLRLSELKKQSDSVIVEVKNENKIQIDELKSELQDSKQLSKSIEDDFSVTKKQLDSENKRLDLQVSKQQISLDVISKRLDEEKRHRALDNNENKQLREKASMLEGELNVWVKINKNQITAANTSIENQDIPQKS